MPATALEPGRTRWRLSFRSNADGLRPALASFRIVLSGLSDAGKTCLLLGLNRAAHLWRGLGDRIRFVPENEASTILCHQSSGFIFRQSPLPDANRRALSYAARLLRVRNGVEMESCHIEVIDTPGGGSFPSPDDPRNETLRSEFLDAAGKANVLVLCVDINNPRLDVLNRHLPELLLKLVGQDGYLALDRLLLLQTKVDRMVARHLEWIQAAREARVRDHQPTGPALDSLARVFTPARLAEHLDPLEYAHWVFGAEMLARIFERMRPGARFAVGLCSALGFDAGSGGPLLNERQGDVHLLSTQSREAKYHAWMPFGVLDILEFLLGGSAKGAVHLLTESDCFFEPALPPKVLCYGIQPLRRRMAAQGDAGFREDT